MIDQTNILHVIRHLIDRNSFAPLGDRLQNRITQEVAELKRQAIKMFANINRWHSRVDHNFRPFDASAIGKARSSSYDNSALYDFAKRNKLHCFDPFDHELCFRAGGKCIAKIGQPYAYTPEMTDRFAAHCGLRVHVPPHPKASIWFPDNCYFIVFTKPDQVVRWLPEQIDGIPSTESEAGSAVIENFRWLEAVREANASLRRADAAAALAPELDWWW